MSCVNLLIRTKSQPFLIFTYQPVIVIFFFRFLAIPFRKNLRSHSNVRSIGYSHFHFTQAHLPRKILTSGQYVSMLCQEGQVLTVTTKHKTNFPILLRTVMGASLFAADTNNRQTDTASLSRTGFTKPS